MIALKRKEQRIKQLEAVIRYMLGALASSHEPWLVEARTMGARVLIDKPVYKCECELCQKFEAWADLGA